MANTILNRCERIPPFLCRMVARTRNGRRGLSHSEIAVRSGLNQTTVRLLSFATTWRGRPIETVEAFSLACGVNHLAAGKQLDFLKRRKWTHIENAEWNQRKMYERLKRLLVEHANKLKQSSS